MIEQRRRLNRVERTTADMAAKQVAQLKDIFPECVTEEMVDFDRLRTTLGDEVDSRPERYSFSWAGKRDCIKILQTPSRATLIPCPEESINFENTNHLFIEGDNLEVLKLLYKPYFERVKMIYIDPPYNTGNDFVYPDNYADPLDTYLQLTGQKDAEGNLLTSNPESSGRYHSTWLSMMYPRLFIARQLLKEDGVIFISIDDHEVHNLRLVMNGIFGEENFIASFIWKSRHNVDSRNETGASTDHEYILCYGRQIIGKSKDMDKYSNPDNDPRGDWMSDNLLGLATKDKRPHLHYDLIDPATAINYGCPETGWRYHPNTMNKKISENRILWPNSPGGRPRHKKFSNELRSKFTGLSTLLNAPNTSAGTQEVRALFGRKQFDFPKPSALIKQLVDQGTNGEEDIVLDFFGGSCTTAQATLELNREDGGNRRFIMVQLPEPTDNKEFPTIAEIGKERIRRVIAKMQKEDEGSLKLTMQEHPEDLGFKVFKLAESNYKQWVGEDVRDPDIYAETLELFTDPLNPGWKPNNLIWEVAIKEGFGLNSRITTIPKLTENVVYLVTDPDKGQTLRICLDDRINAAAVKRLNLGQDDLFICRDAALDDEVAANLALQCRLKTI